MTMITVKNLVKKYGEQTVLRDVTFNTEPQEVFADKQFIKDTKSTSVIT